MTTSDAVWMKERRIHVIVFVYLLGPSSSQLSAWLSGGGSLPQYIWILRLLLFGYESWILFTFPSGDAGRQLLWLQNIMAQRDTLCEKFDQWDLFLFSVSRPLFSTTWINLVLHWGCTVVIEVSSARLSRGHIFKVFLFIFLLQVLRKCTLEVILNTS